MSSFVATLGTYSLLEGAWIWYLSDQTLSPTKPMATPFVDIGRASLFGIYAPFYVAIILAMVAWFVLSYLPTGRRMYAVGGNRQAARLSGIKADRMVIGAFVAAGLLAGIGGLLLGAQYLDASPGAGSELLFPAFAAVFLGATTIRPGRYNIVGLLVAAYALAFMISGLQQLGGVWSEQWIGPTFNGAALVIGVALSTSAFAARERRSKREQLRRLVVGASASRPGKGLIKNAGVNDVAH
jgi:ribose transport system permease protein